LFTLDDAIAASDARRTKEVRFADDARNAAAQYARKMSEERADSVPV